MSVPSNGVVSSITCTRRLQFCCGHRVYGHESKCAHLHGHNYVAYVEARAPELDAVGRVVDFGVIKQRVGEWVDKQWDHSMVLGADDPLVQLFRANAPLAGQSCYVMPSNPTAENMAAYLLDIANLLLGGTGVEVVRVQLWETENCYAEAVSSQ